MAYFVDRLRREGPRYFVDRLHRKRRRWRRAPSLLAFLGGSSFEERRCERAEFYSNYLSSYSLLVQLSDQEGYIFSEVLPLKLMNEDEGDVIEGRLPYAVAFSRSVEMYQPTLRLSVTAVRRDDCKYICLCSGSHLELRENEEEQRFGDPLMFSSELVLPQSLKGVVPPCFHRYKFCLDEIDWVRSVDEQGNDLQSLGITGFRRVRLWSEE